jgi:hypothetical protein
MRKIIIDSDEIDNTTYSSKHHLQVYKPINFASQYLFHFHLEQKLFQQHLEKQHRTQKVLI